MDAQERRDAALKVLSGCRMRAPRKYFLHAKAALQFHHDGRHVNGATYSQCKKKTPYSSRRLAERVAAKVLAERGYPVRPYNCPICGCWHLSKKMLRPEDMDAIRGSKTRS